MFGSEDYEYKPKKRKNKKKKIIVITTFIIILTVALIIMLYLTFYRKTPKKNKKVKDEPAKKLQIVNEDSNKRPIAVMIDNNVGNANHMGLTDAYITYEIIVEGGLTRIMAVFKDRNTENIGPIRSSRHYFLDYALESDAIYTHFGWSTFAENDIKSLGVNNINGLYDDAFERNRTIASPHNVFTSIANIYDYAENNKKYDIESDDWKVLKYSYDELELNKMITETKVNEKTGKKEKIKTAPDGILTANNVSMTYSNKEIRNYLYDSEKQVYLRNMNGEAHIDKVSKEQLKYKNIIIEKVENKTIDSYGRQDLETVGKGEGFFITNGYALPIYWEKESRSSKTKYRYLNDKPVKVNDGTTFIQIVPKDSSITIE